MRKIYFNKPERNVQFVDNTIRNTKYTVYSFIPRILKDEFGHFMNQYFLLIGILQLWPFLTPVNPLSIWLSFLCILGTYALKEGIEDYQRHKRDKIANEKQFLKMELLEHELKATFRKIKSCSIRVGDWIKVEKGQEIPSDLLLFSSSNVDQSCFVQTTNIDGETDLKKKHAAETTFHTNHELCYLRGKVTCSAPDSSMYEFEGRLILWLNGIGKETNLNPSSLLLQGTTLKNTEWIIGLVVYTGNETKVGMSKGISKTKWTQQELLLNRAAQAIFGFQILLTLLFGWIGNSWQVKYAVHFWYLIYDFESSWSFLIIPLRFLLLNSMMIPVSMKITMDILKYIYGYFITHDHHFRDPVTSQEAIVLNTTVAEDLGQIEYIVTDKTGTLTENKMKLARCMIGEQTFGEDTFFNRAIEDPELIQLVQNREPSFKLFFGALSLCNSAEIQDDGSYFTLSPDEKALLDACYRMGFRLIHKEVSHIAISINGTEEHYDILKVFPFSPERKRMTIVVSDRQSGIVIALTKGADDALFPLCNPIDEERIQQKRKLKQFAASGLRTMMICSKIIPSMETLHLSLDKVEYCLNVLGIIGIEDKLQDRVPESILELKEAGIKLWMITGDKYDTALQIGSLSCIVEPEMELISIHSSDTPIDIETELSRYYFSNLDDSPFALIIEGDALNYINTIPILKQTILFASAVICCRSTPSQKANIVELLKKEGKVVLAIGDGGNDVPMIQSANVGIGISGQEGQQASRASDYSLPCFKMLPRLILYHGRHFYLRSAFVSQYCFYKSMFICFIQIGFGFFSGFSGTTFFNTVALTFYNNLFTGIPAISYAWDEDVPENIVKNYPQFYSTSQSGHKLNWTTLLSWSLTALLQAAVVLFFVVGGFHGEMILQDGKTIDFRMQSMMAYTCVIFVNIVMVFIHSNRLKWINWCAFCLTCIIYLSVIYELNALPWTDIYNVMTILYSNPQFYLLVVLCCFVCTLPFYFFRSGEMQWQWMQLLSYDKPMHQD